MKKFLCLFREIFSFKGKALSRIISLALGLCIGLILFSYTSYELSYDNFQINGDKIFRVGLVREKDGNREGHHLTYAPLAEAMKQDFPEVEAATCVKSSWLKQELMYGDNVFREWVIYADTSFFRLFSYPLLMGNVEALKDKNNIFISGSVAEKIFGTEPALGKPIWNEGKEWIIAGVFADLPGNTHLKFDLVKPLAAYDDYKGWQGNDGYLSYVRLVNGAVPEGIENRSEQFLAKYVNRDGLKMTLHLQPLQKIHSGDGEVAFRVFLLTLLALVVLVVSGVNYVLLSVASIGKKAKLVGIHKVNGAADGDIFRMFILETGILLMLALALAFGIIFLVRRWVEQELSLSLMDLFTWQNLWIMVLMLAGMLVLAGFFPARLLSSMSFMQIERQIIAGSRRWKSFLLGCQFMMSAFLLVFLWVMIGQTNLLMNHDLGYNTDRLYFVSVPDKEGASPASHLKSQLKHLPFVEGATIAEMLPVDGLSGIQVKKRVEDEDLLSARWLIVDEDFFEVMCIPTDCDESVWKAGNGAFANKKLLKMLQMPQHTGEYLFINGGGYVPLCGISEDFQLGNFYDEQMPLLVSRIQTDRYYDHLNVIFRLSSVTSENLAAVRKILATAVDKQYPEMISYSDRLKEDYSSLFQLQQVVWYMVAIVLIIIVFGLIGYTADEVGRRKREIAVRKVNGAEVPEIMGLLFRKVGWIALCGIPLGLISAYWASGLVLEEFVIQYPLKWWIFAGSTLFVIGMMLSVVYICAYKAAAANPVKSLKSE